MLDEKITLSENAAKVLEIIEQMNILELSNLVKAIEDKFGITAAAPMAFAAGPMAAGSGATVAPVEEEKTEFNAILKDIGAQKLQVIKVVRAITGLGLKEAKDLVDAAPSVVKENASKQEAEDVKAKLAEVGATVEIK